MELLVVFGGVVAIFIGCLISFVSGHSYAEGRGRESVQQKYTGLAIAIAGGLCMALWA